MKLDLCIISVLYADDWSPQSCLGTLFVHFAQHFRQYCPYLLSALPLGIIPKVRTQYCFAAIYAANFPLADDELSKLLDTSNKSAHIIIKKFESLATKQHGAGKCPATISCMTWQKNVFSFLFCPVLLEMTRKIPTGQREKL